MTKTKIHRATVEEVLQSTSDVLFPAELGKAKVKINSKNSDGDTPLHVMVWRRDHYGAELLINAGADINAIGEMGETPMHVAIRQKDLILIDLLLRKGAKTDIRSEFGKTAIDAAKKKNKEIWKAFKKYKST